MAVEDIGARLVLDPGKFIATAQAATDEIKKLNASLLELGATADATMAKLAKSGDAAEAAGGKAATASKETSVAAEEAGGAGALAAGKHGKNIDEATTKTKNLTTATKSARGELDALAAGPLAKIGKIGLVGALGIGAESIDQYMKYQKAMTQLVTQAGLSANRLPAIMQGGLDIGKQTGLDFNDIANQLYRIVSATSGLKETNKQILSLGKSAADIAVLFRVAPGTPTEQVARLFGSLANAGKGGKLQQTGGTPAGMAALLNAAVGTGDIRGQDLIGALGRGVLQAGEGVHAKLPDILTWLDLSTRLGAQPSTSGTLIAHAIQQLSGGTAQAKKVEAMAGIDPNEMENLIRTQGIGAAFQDLSKKLQTWNPESYYPVTMKEPAGNLSAQAQANAWLLANPQQMQSFYNNTATPQVRQEIANQLLAKMFGGARQEIPALTAIENPTLWNAVESEIRAKANSGQYNKDLKTALGTPSQQMDIAMRNLQAYSIELGKDLTPAALKFVHGLVDVASWLDGHRAVLAGLGGVFATIVGLGIGTYAFSKVLKAIDVMKQLFGFMNKLNPMSSASFGKAGVNGPLIESQTKLTLATDRLADVMGVADAEGEGKSAGWLGIPSRAKHAAPNDSMWSSLGLGSKALSGGITAAIAAMIYNSGPEQFVKSKIGQRGATMLGDAGAGAIVGGMALGPFGALVGAGLGAAWGNRGGTPFKPGMNSLQKLEQLQREGFAVSPSQLAEARSRVHGGSSSLSQADALNSNSILKMGQSAFMSNAIARLNTTGDYMGTNSSQYQQQLKLIISNARKFYGTKVPDTMSGPGLEKWLGYVEGAATNKANKARWLSGTDASNKRRTLFYDELNGGNKYLTQQQIDRTQFDIKKDKGLGVSADQMSSLKEQLKQEQNHLQKINEDTSKLTKATDTKSQTTALVDAVKANNTTTNSLLQQIRDALKNLNITVTTPTSGPGSPAAKTART